MKSLVVPLLFYLAFITLLLAEPTAARRKHYHHPYWHEGPAPHHALASAIRHREFEADALAHAHSGHRPHVPFARHHLHVPGALPIYAHPSYHPGKLIEHQMQQHAHAMDHEIRDQVHHALDDSIGHYMLLDHHSGHHGHHLGHHGVHDLTHHRVHGHHDIDHLHHNHGLSHHHDSHHHDLHPQLHDFHQMGHHGHHSHHFEQPHGHLGPFDIDHHDPDHHPHHIDHWPSHSGHHFGHHHHSHPGHEITHSNIHKLVHGLHDIEHQLAHTHHLEEDSGHTLDVLASSRAQLRGDIGHLQSVHHRVAEE